MSRQRTATAIAALAAAAAVAPALAAQPLWELGLGASVLNLPHYRGSDQNHRWLLPLPWAVYRGPILRANRDGARAMLLDSDRVDLDFSVAASPPTRSSDNDARSGMPDLAFTVEIGPNLETTLVRGEHWTLDLRLPVRFGFTVESGAQGIGWTASPALNLDIELQRWNLALQGGWLGATRDFNAYYYEVTPEQARPGRPAYNAPGGAAGWRLTATASRRFGAAWFGAFIRGDTLAGAVFKSSPLVRQRDNFSFGIAASWIFMSSASLVPDDR